MKTGSVEGTTAARHTSAEFLRFLDRVIATQPARKEIHLIADNLSGPTVVATVTISRSRQSRRISW